MPHSDTFRDIQTRPYRLDSKILATMLGVRKLPRSKRLIQILLGLTLKRKGS